MLGTFHEDNAHHTNSLKQIVTCEALMASCLTYANNEFLRCPLGALAWKCPDSTHCVQENKHPQQPYVSVSIKRRQDPTSAGLVMAARDKIECYTSQACGHRNSRSSHSKVIIIKHAQKDYCQQICDTTTHTGRCHAPFLAGSTNGSHSICTTPQIMKAKKRCLIRCPSHLTRLPDGNHRMPRS